MDNVVYINEEEGVNRVVNNVKLYSKLLTKFRNETKLDELITFAESKDWEKAQAAAHTIKGVAANLSLTELYNQSMNVETEFKGKSIKPESLEKIKACLAETLIHVDRVIAKNA